MNRLTAVTLLLRALPDLQHEPQTWSSQLRRQTIGGEGPSERISCASCNGEGSIRKRGIPVACEVCNARGWLVVDAYTRRPIGTLETGVIQRVKAVRCDACAGQGVHGNQQRCTRCGGSGWVELPLERFQAARMRLSADAQELGPADPVVAALDGGFPGAGQAYRQRTMAGSFEELGLALAALRLELPPAYRTVIRVYVEALYEPEALNEEQRLRHDIGLRYTERLMPEPIRVPSWAARNERRRREKLKRKEVAA